MRVGIIGAGTAGMSCAIELERCGLKPVIFERNDFIGEYFPHVSSFLNLITRSITADTVKYIDKELGIKLIPLIRLRKVIHYSPHNQVEVTGPLGYLMIRGKEENSIQKQLFRMIKTQVHFNSFVQPEEIQSDFDFVVVADGLKTVPERYGIWRQVFSAWLKGGVFAGDFAADTLQMWLDNELTKGAYIYSAPYGRHKAVIAHIIQNIEHEELNHYWQRFLESRDILKKHDLLESWELTHQAGFVTTNRIGKIYFAGVAGGGVEPFLGFGQFNAIYSGVMTARSIITGKDINILLKDLNKKYMELISLRYLMNKATNRDFDLLLSIMKTPGFRSMVYKTNIDVVKLISMGLSPFRTKVTKAVVAKGR
jgi:flavin-dependent dehydrogenase